VAAAILDQVEILRAGVDAPATVSEEE